MVQVQLRGCPKCQGDLVQKVDLDGSYTSCVQCGVIAEDWQQAEESRAAARARLGRKSVKKGR